MKLTKRNSVWIFVFLTVAFIAYRDLVTDTLPFLVFSAICAFGALCTDCTGRFFYVISLLPFCRGIPYSEMLLIISVVEIGDMLVHRRPMKCAVLYVFLLTICIVEVMNYIWHDIASNEIVYLLVYMFYATYAVAQNVYVGHERQCIWYYSIAKMAAIMLVMIREVAQYGWDYFFVYNARFGNNTAGHMVTGFNANEMGLYCIMAVALLLTLYHFDKNKISLILAMIVSCLGVFSVSRTYLVVLVITWLFFLLERKLPLKQFCLFAVLLILVIIAVFTLFPDVTEWILSYTADRFDEGDTRTPLMLQYIDISFSSLWGALFGYSQNYLVVTDAAGAVHNGLQEVFVCWGMVGTAFFALWVIELYRRGIEKLPVPDFRRYASTAIFWLYIQTLQLVTMHNYLLVMMVSFVSINMKRGTDCAKRIG